MTEVIALSDTTAEENKQEGPAPTGDVNEFVLELIRDAPEDWNRYELDCGLCESTGLVNWLYDEKTAEEDRDLVNDCIYVAIREAFCRAIAKIVRKQWPATSQWYDKMQKRPDQPRTVEDVARMIVDERQAECADLLIEAVANYIHAEIDCERSSQMTNEEQTIVRNALAIAAGDNVDAQFREHVRRVAAFIADFVKDQCPFMSDNYEREHAETVEAVAERVFDSTANAPVTTSRMAGMVEDVIHGIGEIDGVEEYYRPSAERADATEADFAAWCSRDNRHSAFVKTFVKAFDDACTEL